MTIIFAILGGILGGFFSYGFGIMSGWIPGALLGYLLASVLDLRKQLNALKQDVTRLGKAETPRPTQAVPSRPTPATAQAAPPRPAEAAVPATVTPAPEVSPAAKPAVVMQAAVHEVKSSRAAPRAEASATVDEPAILRYLKAYFSGPNILARVGVIVLFFGVAFLLKYAAERSEISVEFRLMGVAIASIVMLIIGWRLRVRLNDYALILQGASIGVLYLTVFAALRLYQALPPGLTLLILVAVGVFSSILAVVQNARSLAILGICGGFLAPLLTSTGDGSHVMLFTYYALLNAGIFGMAWFKSWRPLNLLGFAFTFVIATFWGVTRYQAEQFATTEPFLILFFLFYVGIPILYAQRQAPELKGYVDGTLVFGTPLIAMGLQAGMMQQASMLQVFEYGLAVSAVVLSLFYLLTAKILYQRKHDSLRLLVEYFLALGVVLATLAIPFALDGRWISASWALEGAAILWIGLRQKRLLPRVFGTLLQFAAGFILLTDFDYSAAPLAVFNSIYIGSVLISFAGLFSAWYLQRRRADIGAFEHTFSYVLFTWGALWWLGAGLREIDLFVGYRHDDLAALLFFAFSSLGFSLLCKRLVWPVARIPALALLPAMIMAALVQWFSVAHPFAGLAYIGWLAAFATLYRVLQQHENEVSAATIRVLHMLALWLLSIIIAWEVSWIITHLIQVRGTWPMIAWALVPGLILGGLSLYGQRLRWPVAAFLPTYLGLGAVPLAAYLWLWSLLTNLSSDGNPYPISYMPLLNPLDLAQVFVFLMLATWLLKIRQLKLTVLDSIPLKLRYAIIAATLFVWLNAALLRTLHYWADVPFNRYAMMHSVLVQASISIFWSVLALTIMRVATQKQLRTLWVIGSVLMAAVVLKLFTIDISGIGSLERIVSFIGVALLMLVVGYIAPLPAKKEEVTEHA